VSNYLNKEQMHELTIDESQELEKCFYEMQGKCEQEIDKIDEILRPSKAHILPNTDFHLILVDATNKIGASISLAVRFYLEKSALPDVYQLSTSMSKDVAIIKLTKEIFIDNLNKEIRVLAMSILSVQSANTVLHPTIFIPYNILAQKILDIRPSKLFSMAHEVLVGLNK